MPVCVLCAARIRVLKCASDGRFTPWAIVTRYIARTFLESLILSLFLGAKSSSFMVASGTFINVGMELLHQRAMWTIGAAREKEIDNETRSTFDHFAPPIGRFSYFGSVGPETWEFCGSA